MHLHSLLAHVASCALILLTASEDNRSADVVDIMAAHHLELTVEQILHEESECDEAEHLSDDAQDFASKTALVDMEYSAEILDTLEKYGVVAHEHDRSARVKLHSARGLRSMWKLWCALVVLSLVELILVVASIVFDRFLSPCDEERKASHKIRCKGFGNLVCF